jgi:hypothetical protein
MPTPEDGQHGQFDPKSHADDPSVKEGYEVTDASVGGIMVFLIGLFISVGVFFVLCFVMGKVINNGLDRQDGPVNKWAAQNQIAPRKAIQSSPALEQAQLAQLSRQFPTPRLETDDGNLDLTQLHDREDLLLNYYSWIDRSKGTVRIPVERAMEIIAEHGLPVMPAEQQQPLMMGDAEPVVQMPLTDGFARTAYEQAQHGPTGEAGEQASSKANNQ